MISLDSTHWIVLFIADVVTLGGLLIWAFYELEQARQRAARNKRLRAWGPPIRQTSQPQRRR